MDKEQAIETLRANYPDACYEQLREAVDAAIEALKAQDAAGDTISRQAAIDAHYEYCNKHPDAGFPVWSLKILEDLPSAQPEHKTGRWIPCSERLPEKYGNYLISIHGEDEPDIGTINPNDKRGWSLCDANGFYWARNKELIVTAWIPLPECYREGEG